MPPDFDHVVSMQQAPGVSGVEPTDERLRKGLALAIDGRPDNPGDGLREGDQVAASFVGDRSAGSDLRLVVGREFYLEEGELGAGEEHSH